MITLRNGDLIRAFDDGLVDAIAHQCNTLHCMGAGLARAIAARYPQAERADRATDFGEAKLGTFSRGDLPDDCCVYNLYSQRDFVRPDNPCATDYALMRRALAAAADDLVDRRAHRLGTPVLGVPHGIGCGLAGGSWFRVLDEVIMAEFGGRDGVVLAIWRLQI